MKQDERQARIKAIQYILDNKLYDEGIKDDIYDEMRALQANKEYNSEPAKTSDDILEDRGKHYGSFNQFVDNMVTVMNVLKRQHGDEKGIVHKDIDNFFLTLKLLRLQTAKDDDSLIDLENYAKLIRRRRNGDNQ